jgi:hypothetical protein
MISHRSVSFNVRHACMQYTHSVSCQYRMVDQVNYIFNDLNFAAAIVLKSSDIKL